MVPYSRIARHLLVFCGLSTTLLNAAPPKPHSDSLLTPASPLGLPPVIWPPDNPYSPSRVELGRILFFDARLSVNRSVSCASCHKPEHAFSSGESLSRGVTGKTGRRRAPTLINRAFGRSQFWDGRVATLEAQIVAPITNPDEMGMSQQSMVAVVEHIPGYAALFKAAFGDPAITFDHVAKAIASFERTILSGNSPYDRYKAGDKRALTAAQRRGMDIFERKGECAECHSGYNFTSEKFANLGIGMDRPKPDLGLAEISLKRHDEGKFKVPTLREIVHTGPYMHDGRFQTLGEVLEFYRRGAVRNPHLDSRITAFYLDTRRKADLKAFLESLSGEGWQHLKAPEHLPQ